MKFHRNNKYLYWGVTAFSVGAACMLFYFAIFHMDSLKGGISRFLSILMPLIYGAVMAYLFSPVVNFLENQVVLRVMKRFKRTVSERFRKVVRMICVLLAICLVLLCIYALLAMLIPEILNSIINIIDNFPRYIDNIQSWTTKILKDNSALAESINELFNKYFVKAEHWLTNDMLPQLNSLIKNFSLGLIGVVAFLKNLVLGFIISVYILYSKETLIGNAKKGLYALFRAETANQIIKDVQYIDNAFGGFLVGRIVDSAIIGVLCYIGTSFLDMPYALLISVIVGVTNVIPYFGPFMGAIPSAVLIFMVSPMQAVYFVIFILVLQQFDGNILGPMILRGVTGLTSFLVVVSIILGGGLFGVVGMIVSVPVCMVVCTIVRNYLDERLEEKKMCSDKEYYTNIDHIDAKTYRQVKTDKREIDASEVFQFKKRRNQAGPEAAEAEKPEILEDVQETQTYFQKKE